MKRYKILFVDDVAPIQNMVKTNLTALGYLVETASDGEEGWEYVMNWKPDLVITDLVMPNLNGLDLLSRIRSTQQTARLPVLCATGEESATFKRNAKARGATGWIQKPFNPATWQETLDQILTTHGKRV